MEYTVDGRGLRQSRAVGAATDDLVWSTIGGLPLLLDDGDHAYLYGPSLAPVAQVDGSGAVEYLHGDLLGSVRTITDSTGAVVGTSTFDAFGSRTAHTGTADSAFGFTGNWTDPDTGLVHLRARDYDPATGQFLSVDPAVDSTRQPYAYTGNNPLMLTDPSGLDPSVMGVLANITTAFMGYADGVSFGLWNNFFDAVAPGMRCALYDRNPELYEASSFTGTVAFNVALFFVPGGALVQQARLSLFGGRAALDIAGAAFAQRSASFAFGSAGKFANQTINDVAAALRTGMLLPSEVPVGMIAREGSTLILNTRSALALTAADIPRAAWSIVNQTGIPLFERLLTGQLARNGLSASGIMEVVIKGMK